jgi:hypothetical protein
LFLLFTGCYAYAPIEPSAARPGVDVRARISAASAERLAPLLGAADNRVLAGRLIEMRADMLIVEVPVVAQAGIGSTIQTLHQRVSIARGELLELETRTLDRMRTAVLVGAATVLVGGGVIKATRGEPGKDRFVPPGGNDSRRP